MILALKGIANVVNILRRVVGGLVTAMAVASMSVAYALDGSNPVFVTTPTGISNGWKTFEILSGGDDLGERATESFAWTSSHDDWDGLGAYRHDADTLRVFINHEASHNSSFSRVDLELSALKDWIVAGIANNSNGNQVAPAEPIVREVSLGWSSVVSGTDPIENPCTGNTWLADTFGPGRGFAESLHLVAEEVFSNRHGHIWVMDLATRELYEVPDLGQGSWENATILDTGRTDTVALILSEDIGSEMTGNVPIRLYVGQKDPESDDFLARNGLVGGQIYYWHSDLGMTNGTIKSPSPGIFSAGNGSVIPGEWKSTDEGAVWISKSEDLHTNMDKDSEGYGVQVALASQGEGIFLIDCSDLEFVAGDLAEGARESSVMVLYEADTQAESLGEEFKDMDNLVWSADGKLYVNEDDGEGDIWVLDVASLLASYALYETEPSESQVYQILDADYVQESSGVIDISEALDYRVGSVFLTTGLSENLTDNQLALCVSPDALLKADVYHQWVEGYIELDSEADRLATADPDLDGLDNATEFALGLSPVVAASKSPLDLQFTETQTEASFVAAHSLDLVDYYVDYSEDLSEGFLHTVHVRAADVGAGGFVTLMLPKSDQLFARIRAVLP